MNNYDSNDELTQKMRRPRVGNKPIKEKLNARLMHALHKLTYAERFLRDNEFVKYQFIIKCHFQQYIQVDDLFEKKKEFDPHSNS